MVLERQTVAALTRLLRRCAPLAILAGAAQVAAVAQPISAGVRGGAQLIKWHTEFTGAANATGTDDSSRWVAGPFVSVKLPAAGLAIQAEALRRHYGFSRNAISRPGVFNIHEEIGSAWEFPLMLMWRPDYQENGWRPLIGAGPAVRYVSADAADIVRTLSGETRSPGRPASNRAGLTATAGMERQLGPLVVSTELRYSYWATSKAFLEVFPNHNQVSILLGIRTR